jgi:hypothetical protein
MNHPLDAIPARLRVRTFVALLVATFAVMGVLLYVDSFVQGHEAPRGIVSFELVGSGAHAKVMLDAWGSLVARGWVGFSLGFDYLFMPLYSTSIAAALVWLSTPWTRRGLAIVLAWAAWVAACADAVENACLTRMLTSGPDDTWAEVGTAAATFKFALLAPALLFVFIAVIARVVQRRA